jgi:hypothetical protein
VTGDEVPTDPSRGRERTLEVNLISCAEFTEAGLSRRRRRYLSDEAVSRDGDDGEARTVDGDAVPDARSVDGELCRDREANRAWRAENAGDPPDFLD